MNTLPCSHQPVEVCEQDCLYSGQITSGESVILAKCDRAALAVQLKDCFVPTSDDMDVSGAMIVWVNDDTKTANPEHGWHL
jgi:hypothetical protein